MGRASKLKKLRRSLRENLDPEIQMQMKSVIVGVNGMQVTKTILRHNPNSYKGMYKKIKKQGDYGEE